MMSIRQSVMWYEKCCLMQIKWNLLKLKCLQQKYFAGSQVFKITNLEKHENVYSFWSKLAGLLFNFARKCTLSQMIY